MTEDEMTHEDEAFLADLEALFAEAGSEAPGLPPELEVALKQQTRDRLAPVTFSVGEILVVALAGVLVLTTVAGGSWGTEQLLVLVPVVVAYCAATLVFARERDGADD